MITILECGELLNRFLVLLLNIMITCLYLSTHLPLTCIRGKYSHKQISMRHNAPRIYNGMFQRGRLNKVERTE